MQNFCKPIILQHFKNQLVGILKKKCFGNSYSTMSFHKRMCISLLDGSSEDNIPSILLVGDLEENLEHIATQLLNEADFHQKAIKVNSTNKLPLLGIYVEYLAI